MNIHPKKRANKFKLRKAPFRFSLGERGELAAWDFLTQKGYRLLEKNYRCPLGEIDGIAEKGGRIIFVEVKTRSSDQFGRPEEAVTEAKQKKLVRLADWYLKENKKTDAAASFAVVAVVWSEATRDPEIRLIENAFSIEEFLR